MFTNLSNRMKTTLQVAFVSAFVGGAIALLISLGVMRTSSDSHLVNFEVKASGGFATITLQAGNEKISTPTTVTSPWKRSIRIKSGTEVYLTASNPSQIGDITCSILLDKNPWKLEKTTSPKNGVACAGIVP